MGGGVTRRALNVRMRTSTHAIAMSRFIRAGNGDRRSLAPDLSVKLRPGGVRRHESSLPEITTSSIRY